MINKKQTGGRKIAVPKVKIFKLDKIKMADYNPRIIDEANLAGLAESIQQFGCIEPIVVNIHQNKNTIISGHQRFKVLRAMDAEKCLCVALFVMIKNAVLAQKIKYLLE